METDEDVASTVLPMSIIRPLEKSRRMPVVALKIVCEDGCGVRAGTLGMAKR